MISSELLNSLGRKKGNPFYGKEIFGVLAGAVETKDTKDFQDLNDLVKKGGFMKWVEGVDFYPDPNSACPALSCVPAAVGGPGNGTGTTAPAALPRRFTLIFTCTLYPMVCVAASEQGNSLHVGGAAVNESLGADYRRFLHQTGAIRQLGSHRGLEGGGSGGGNKWDLLMAAATRPRGERAQLDIQQADVDALISWALPIRGADAAGDQESPARSSRL
ncbi:hypothetical protein NADE_002010 [Nannochloris sp. 'desiccata']|nr:hypothetical protein KSW81_002968 [Chlorella desiccata (nom. nud.)]KAH7624787.1 hypothetical protein NADE_002010 [Chlorella desiccata (nom. nud.)]